MGCYVCEVEGGKEDDPNSIHARSCRRSGSKRRNSTAGDVEAEDIDGILAG